MKKKEVVCFLNEKGQKVWRCVEKEVHTYAPAIKKGTLCGVAGAAVGLLSAAVMGTLSVSTVAVASGVVAGGAVAGYGVSKGMKYCTQRAAQKKNEAIIAEDRARCAAARADTVLCGKVSVES